MKQETDEEIVAYFEGDPHDFDKTIFTIAQYIEVSGLSYNGLSQYNRDGKWLLREEWWNILSVHEKRERLRQAMGAWNAIQDIGVSQVLRQTFASYVAEK